MPDSNPAPGLPHVATPPYTRTHHAAPERRLRTVLKRGTIYDVAPDVIGLKTGIVNVYLIGAPGSKDWVLVDAGMPGSARAICKAAADRFGWKVPPKAILLTHGHFDHVGALQNLLRLWDVPVYAHPAEMPFVTGQSDYPPPDPTVGGGLMTWSSFVFPKKPIDLRGQVRPLPADGEIPELPGWRAIPTPGHTPGHVSFFREQDRVLVAGDAFVTIHAESLFSNLTLEPLVQRPPAYFTPDWPAVKTSLVRLAELRPNIAATGHGQPLYGPEMLEALQRLAYGFERHPYGLPAGGRYRETPALFDRESGVLRLPPLQVLPYLKAGAVGLLAALLITTVHRLSREED